MTPSLFDPGLEHITVAETKLSKVDGEAGKLIIGGFPVEDLAANATYEESFFLLLHDRLPTATEHEALRRELANHRTIDEDIKSLLQQAAVETRSAMTALRIGLAAADLGTETDRDDPKTVAKRVVAVVPTIVATYWRYRQELDPVDPDAELGHAANYYYMVTGRKPSKAATKGLETFLTTIIDHGLNTSTFAARVVTSTESDLISAATAAVGALKGPRHGGNLIDIFEMVCAVQESSDTEAYVRERLASDDRLIGFGHRIYQVRDPRAAVLAATAERFYAETGEDDVLETIRELESAAVDVLSERRSEPTPQPTVEFYAAALLYGLDVPSPLFPATFAVSRVGGWMAHCFEQRDNNRLIRPVSRYIGDTDREWTPVEHREHVEHPLLGQSPQSVPLEPVSETLAALSEPARLEILLVLYDTESPLAYSSLKNATTIDDKGRFNYHLRQLRDYFVVSHDDGYTLTETGRTLVEAVLDNDRLLDTTTD